MEIDPTVANSRREPDKLWRLIEEQKRLADCSDRSAVDVDIYSHDSKQTWVQAVFACLKSQDRKPLGRRAARQRLHNAILRSEQAYRRRCNVTNDAWMRSPVSRWTYGVGIAIALLIMLAALYFLPHATIQP
jgi:hypothetical protein